MPTDLAALPLWGLLLVFAAAGAAVWAAGTRLSRYVDGLARETGLGKAFSGMLLLGGITSLPEVAAVSTSAALGNAPLAVNNLIGTASVNLLLLAVADIVYGRGALTAVAATPATLMQGVLSMFLMTVVASLATVGDVAILGVGAGTTLLLLGCVAALWIASAFEQRHVWEVVRREDERDEPGPGKPGAGDRLHYWPLRKLVAATAAAALVILLAGYFLSTSADAIAGRTGLEAGMVGFLLVGFATSLPEISAMTSAIRMGAYDMAVGDIFGTNLFNIAIIFLADAVYAGAPVMALSGRFEAMGAMIAILLTGAFVVGLLDRRRRAVLRMGYDSIGALLLFAGGVALLARLGG